MTTDETTEFMRHLGGRAEAKGIVSLNAHEQTVLRPWAALGVIGNGGFGFFYEGDWDLEPVAEGFRALGFADAARACDEVLARLRTHGPIPQGLNLRWDWHEGVDWDQFEPQESLVYGVSFESLAEAVDRYIHTHRQAFAAWCLPLEPLLRVVRP